MAKCNQLTSLPLYIEQNNFNSTLSGVELSYVALQSVQGFIIIIKSRGAVHKVFTVSLTGLHELLQTVETSPRRMSRKDWAPATTGSPRHRQVSSDILRASASTQSAFSSPVRQHQPLLKEPHRKTSESVAQTSKIRRALLRFNLLSRADR